MGHIDAELSVQFTDKVHHAHAYLQSEMKRLGLFEADGWKIIQVTREGRGGTEMVLRPFHSKKWAPEGLECIVWVSAEPTVDSECAPAKAAPPRADDGRSGKSGGARLAPRGQPQRK